MGIAGFSSREEIDHGRDLMDVRRTLAVAAGLSLGRKETK